MAAQEQEIHLDRGRVGGLDQDDAIGRDLGDGVDRKVPGQHVEAVEDQADMLMVGAAHRLPGLAVVVDVAAPGEGLEADLDAELPGEVAELVQVGRNPRHIVDRLGRDAAADQEQRRAEPAHKLELALRALEGLAAQWLGQAFEVTERLQRDDLEAERAGPLAHVLGPAVEVGEIVLEDLDPVEARLGGSGELVGERPGHAHGCDGSRHEQASSNRAPIPTALQYRLRVLKAHARPSGGGGVAAASSLTGFWRFGQSGVWFKSRRSTTMVRTSEIGLVKNSLRNTPTCSCDEIMARR